MQLIKISMLKMIRVIAHSRVGWAGGSSRVLARLSAHCLCPVVWFGAAKPL